MTELEQIKMRFRDHYSRGLGEPVGLPRVAWVEDTAWLISEVDRLTELYAFSGTRTPPLGCIIKDA